MHKSSSHTPFFFFFRSSIWIWPLNLSQIFQAFLMTKLIFCWLDSRYQCCFYAIFSMKKCYPSIIDFPIVLFQERCTILLHISGENPNCSTSRNLFGSHLSALFYLWNFTEGNEKYVVRIIFQPNLYWSYWPFLMYSGPRLHAHWGYNLSETYEYFGSFNIF